MDETRPSLPRIPAVPSRRSGEKWHIGTAYIPDTCLGPAPFAFSRLVSVARGDGVSLDATRRDCSLRFFLDVLFPPLFLSLLLPFYVSPTRARLSASEWTSSFEAPIQSRLGSGRVGYSGVSPRTRFHVVSLIETIGSLFLSNTIFPEIWHGSRK